MLNPVTRICVGLAVLFLIFAAVAWMKAANAPGDRVLRIVKDAAFPTSVGLGLLGAGLAAMMLFGPWARPYQYSPELEGMTDRDGAPDITE
jgi:hypothetical protein